MSILTLAWVIPVAFTIFVTILNILPNSSDIPLPSEVSDGLTLVLQYVFAWGDIFPPLYHLFTAALWGIGIAGIVLTWRMIRWVIGVVRGSRA